MGLMHIFSVTSYLHYLLFHLDISITRRRTRKQIIEKVVSIIKMCYMYDYFYLLFFKKP